MLKRYTEELGDNVFEVLKKFAEENNIKIEQKVKFDQGLIVINVSLKGVVIEID
jgi:hypothetical protein